MYMYVNNVNNIYDVMIVYNLISHYNYGKCGVKIEYRVKLAVNLPKKQQEQARTLLRIY